MTMVRRSTYVFILIIAVILACGCQSVPLQTRPPLEDEGEVFLYLQPFTQAAERLRFSLAGISAIREDGSEIPLSLSLKEIQGTDMKRQRLLAVGRLPYGRYSGFAVGVTKATLTAEHGEAALLVPETSQKSDFLFTVERKKAVVIVMALKYAESVREGINFTPAFAVSIPRPPLTELTGYVSNEGDDTITIFDKVKLEATGAIAVEAGPTGMALDRQLKRAYVALPDDDAIDAIDVAAGTILTRVLLVRGDRPRELALTPDGRTLLAVDTGSNNVSIIDTGSLMEVSRISVGRGPRSVLIDATGRKAYVFNGLSDNISVIDIAYRTVMGTISTGPGPLRGQFNRAGDRLYVAHENYPYLEVFDPAKFNMLHQEFMGTGVASIKVDAVTDLIYVGKKGDAMVTVYDPMSFAPIDYIQAGGTAGYMTIDNETNNLYIVVPEQRMVSVVNLVSKKRVTEIDVSESPYWVIMLGER